MKYQIGHFVGTSICLIAILVACEGPKERKIAGEVAGEKIYLDEVDNLITNSLYEYLFAIFDARSIAANELISSKILEMEARARNMPVDSLLLLETVRIGKTETKAKYVFDNALQAGVVDEKRPFELHKLDSEEGKEILDRSYQKYLKVRLVDELRAKYETRLSLERPQPPAVRTDGLLTHVSGKVNSAISVVVISDFNCPVCRRIYPELSELLEKYKNHIRFEAINLSPSVTTSILLSECAGRQGRFWDAYNALFVNDVQPMDMDTLINRLALDKTACLKCLKSERIGSEITESMHRLRSLGIPSVLTLYPDRILSLYTSKMAG